MPGLGYWAISQMAKQAATRVDVDISLYALFLVTTVMLILVPGPAAITVAAQGASHSLHLAFFGVLGVATADVLFFTLSATGIASLILASNLVFSIIKWFGVVYLFYLGITALRSQSGVIRVAIERKQGSRSRLFSQGLVVQLANPKALMYFTALLPQFVDPSKPVLFQMLLMGASCLLADVIVYSVFARLGDRIARQQLQSWVTTLISKAAGIALISTGIKMVSLEHGK